MLAAINKPATPPWISKIDLVFSIRLIIIVFIILLVIVHSLHHLKSHHPLSHLRLGFHHLLPSRHHQLHLKDVDGDIYYVDHSYSD